MTKVRFLSGNALKLIGAVSMLIDHMGLMLFPDIIVFRIIGRLALPIFAFMISEGTRYTKSKPRYFLTMLIVGILCQLPYSFLGGDTHLNTFITFTVSIILIYSLDFFKQSLFNKDHSIFIKALALLIFLALCFLVYLLNTRVSAIHIDYGLYGCFMAVFASAPSLNKTQAPEWLKKFDNLPMRILCLLVPVLFYCKTAGRIQYFCLIALVLLLLYSGKRGKAKMKYFFYIFYPVHLAVLFLISLVI